MKYYELNVGQVLKELSTSEEGLSSKEALDRLNKYGSNKLKEGKKKSKISEFLNQFNDIMIIILIISAIFSFVISIIQHESFMDSIVIITVVILNAILGFIQELKADKAIENLKQMQVSKVKVKRDNKIVVVDANDVVIGDILVLEAGDTVSADARIIWEASLKVDESSLTGESISVNKTIDELKGNISLSERTNMVYSGTNITYGKCLAVVTETGMNTEIGKIASSLTSDNEDLTPLQVKINEISKALSIIVLIIIAVILIVGLFRKMELVEILMLSISLAVAAIPEGLPAVITIILSLGMGEMARKKAIVRKMSSVETLGCTEIICSDKTGTITQNKMSVREIFYNDNLYNNNDDMEENILLDIMILNNDVEKSDDEYIGDPTEIALYSYCETTMDIDDVRISHKRVSEIPFDSERKMMSTINVFDDGDKLLTKGSFDSIILNCSKILENGQIYELTDEIVDRLKKVEANESNRAYRVLAYAYKDLQDDYVVDTNLESDLIFVGMTCMIDPPRNDVKNSISLCKSAHIKPVMITGDSLSTAISIAKEIGIIDSDDEAILGVDLDKYSDEELKDVVNKYSVYARVSPINKLSIVKAWKANNKVVAMTGDGVNDAPALKDADIGVGMGITGTEVSKGVSDIILSDDSFSTIVTAVREGRRIYDNIRNILVYLLTSNITEVLIVFIGMLFGIEVFLPIQLLYLNLITDSLPAISLAFESEQQGIMERDVRKKDSSFFTNFLIAKISLSSILKTIALLVVYFVNINFYEVAVVKTMAFLTLILLELFFAYSCRDLKKNVLNKNMFKNKYLNICTIGLFITQIIVFLTPIRKIFGITFLSLPQTCFCILTCMVVFVIEEFSKVLMEKFKD